MILALLVALTAGCQPGSQDTGQARNGSIPEADTLRQFETVIAQGNILLDRPVFMKSDPSSGHLFLYDDGIKTIFEFDGEYEVASRYGGGGQGPGELSQIANLFVNTTHLFAHDPREYFIHRYNRQNGEVASHNYGQRTQSTEGPVPMASLAYNSHPGNSRAVTLNGNILQPAHEAGEYLYELTDWEGSHLADIAPMPEGYQSELETEAYREALENGEVPATDLHRAFPVSDRANPDELFLVYSAIPKIEKYDTSGNKLWESAVPHTPELDRLSGDHMSVVEMFQFARALPLRKYTWGVSSPEGALYLATYTNLALPGDRPTLWVHRFSADGAFTHRFALRATEEDGNLLPFVAVDFESHEILAIHIASGEVRAYPFEI